MSGGKPDGPSFVRRVTGKLGRSSGVQVDEDLWASIQLARHAERPYTLDYINRITSDFEEMHGDRLWRRPGDGRWLRPVSRPRRGVCGSAEGP